MSLTNLRILVTGANGFLGANILKAFSSQKNIIVVAACRDKNKLPDFFKGEVREGDLRHSRYRQSVVKDIDVICHAGTWATMWGHVEQEKEYFYNPTIDLIEHAITAGVKRFLMTSTVVIAKVHKDGSIIDDFSPPSYSHIWPHLDRLVDVDTYMQKNAHRGMQMVTMRLGHFIGAGNKVGIVPALVPRLKTGLVPWLGGGKSRLPLIADSDAANSYVAATFADHLKNYESFNLCGTNFPTTREVIETIANKAGVSKPLFSVPYPVGYLFGWLMEVLFPLLPGKAPFLTRSIVHLSEDWFCDTQYAKEKLGYRPEKDWKIAMEEALDELDTMGYPWLPLSQK
jgi:nucleoside-diphosphate-sugar epimerase